MNFREAIIEDIPQMQRIRHSVRENMLSDPSLVRPADYEAYILLRGKGWVSQHDGKITGFSIADLRDHNIWALFVDPRFEGRGIGRELHRLMLEWYFSKTKTTLWLSTSPSTRAELFYRNAGWKETGKHGKNEIRFEMTYEDWTKLHT